MMFYVKQKNKKRRRRRQLKSVCGVNTWVISSTLPLSIKKYIESAYVIFIWFLLQVVAGGNTIIILTEIQLDLSAEDL